MTGVVTVADLLNRHAPTQVRVDDADDATRAISVGSLLRREGRTPHALERPIQPQAHQQFDESAEEPVQDRKVLVRRSAIAAGTLLAAGSVFGAAVLTEVVPTGADALDPPAGGGYPGQGLLDPEGSLTPPDGTVQLDQASVSNPLDPGAPAPTSWIPVAFPGAVASVPTAAAATAHAAALAAGGLDTSGFTGGTGSAGTETGGTGGGAVAPTTPLSSTGGGDAGAGGGDAGTSGGISENNTVVGDLGDGLGGTANGLGDTVGGPVGDTVGGLGDTVNGTADTLDGVAGGLLGGGDTEDSDDDSRSSARSYSSESSASDDDSSSSSAPRAEESSDDDRDSDKSSGGLLGTVGDLAGGLLG